MTYNFDPDRWYDNERAVICAQYAAGKLTRPEYEKALDALEQQYEDMWQRLDGSFRI